MALSLDLKNIDNFNDVKSGGFQKTPVGRGLVRCNSFGEFSGNKGAHELKFEIIAWSDPSAIGMEHQENIFPPDPGSDKDYCTPKLLRLAIATGVITPKQAEDVKSGIGEVEIDLVGALPGRLMFTEIAANADKKDATKFYHNVADFGNAYFHIHDPRVAGWPTNQGVLNAQAALVGKWEPTTTSAPGAAASAPGAAASAPGAAASLRAQTIPSLRRCRLGSEGELTSLVEGNRCTAK
jgi:hypothetical protein